jgi:hypothetical protein
MRRRGRADCATVIVRTNANPSAHTFFTTCNLDIRSSALEIGALLIRYGPLWPGTSNRQVPAVVKRHDTKR